MNEVQLAPERLHDYQCRAISFALQRHFTMLWLDMGLGKTIVALSTMLELIDRMEVHGVLIVGPKRVVQTVWRQEAAKWTHTAGLRFSLIAGNRHQRHRAMRVNADIYLVNYENLSWLIQELSHVYLGKGKYPPFNAVIFDEVSRMKDSSTIRHGEYRKLMPFLPYRMGLTGTPAGNGYKDLHGQYLAIDGGERLGIHKQDFQTAFQAPDFWSEHPAYKMSPGSELRIEKLVGDITIQMDAKDYLSIPEEVYQTVWIDLPSELRADYDKLEEEMFLELDEATIEVFNAAALSTKCRQYAQGAMYITPGEPEWAHVHDEKLDALSEVVEEAAGKPVLVSFEYRHDAARIMRRFPGARWLNASLSESAFKQLEEEWNLGHIPMLIGHPGSMGHGLNLQYGPCTHMVQFGIDWSLDLNQQVVARLVRQNQEQSIIIHRLLIQDTVEVAMQRAYDGKYRTEDGLKKAMNEYRSGRYQRMAA